jgi:hypothetical protein
LQVADSPLVGRADNLRSFSSFCFLPFSAAWWQQTNALGLPVSSPGKSVVVLPEAFAGRVDNKFGRESAMDYSLLTFSGTLCPGDKTYVYRPIER